MKAAEKRKRTSAIVIGKAKNAHEKLSLVLQDRFVTKPEQISKYK